MVAKKPASVMKRKGMSRLARFLNKGRPVPEGETAKGVEDVENAEEVPAAGEEDAEEAEQGGAQEGQQEEETQEEKQKRQEEETQQARSKELKSMAVDDLKALATRLGLDPKQKKTDLVEAVVGHEASARAQKLANEARRRAAVVQKKEELDGLSISDLAKACDAANIVGLRSKHDRVEHLLKCWLDAGGIATALKQQQNEARRQELLAIDSLGLRELCEQRGIDPFVQEVAADRLLWHEAANMAVTQEGKAKDDAPKADLVDSLLARETEKQQQEAEKERSQGWMAAKRKELKAMGVEELREALTSRDRETEGNKEALVEALLEVQVREEAVNARRLQLTKMPLDELKGLLLANGLDACKRKREELVGAMLAHEAQSAKRQQAREAARQEAVTAKMQELADKGAAELKELCAAKELAVGGNKDALVGRLAECARQDGEIDRAATMLLRAARARELRAMDRALLIELCEKASVDPCVKEVMVERIMAHAEEAEAAEPAAKRAKR